MARYIDADLLKEKLKGIIVTDDLFGMGISRGLERAETIADMMPTADVAEVKHGHWICDIRKFSVMDDYGYIRETEKKTHTCSLCRVGIAGLEHMSYCPYCGAKMDGKDSAK